MPTTTYQLANGDVARHIVYGHALNPYSTPSARRDWQHGYNGTVPLVGHIEHLEHNLQYQRGRKVRQIMEAITP